MFNHFLDSITHYLHHHPQMGMMFAFVVAFLESLPIVGTIVPGSITMTAVGAMIGAGLIPGYSTLAIASLGAFVGDVIGFATGRIFKDKLRYVWPFKKHPKIISVSETFIEKHGGKSILIGRFVGAVRSAVPMVAGVLHLSWIRFIIAALPTAILWAIVYSLPGIILGAFSMEIPPTLLTEYIILGVVIIFLLWVIYWLIQRFFTNISQFYHRQIDRYWTFLQKHRGSHAIIQYIYNRQDLEDHHQLSRLILATLCVICFIVILLNVLCHTGFVKINAPAFAFAQSLRIYNLDPFFITLTLFGKTIIVMLIGFVLAFILACARQWRASAHLCFATLFAGIIVYGIKFANFSPRPTGFMIVASSSSFPSGHTTLSLVVFGLLAFFTGQYFKNHRGIINTIVIVLIALIAASRLYLGAHWLLDVIASLFLGTAILLLTIINFQRLPRKTSILNLNKWWWLTYLFIVVAGIWAGNVYFEYHTAFYRYTPYTKRIVTTEENWWKNPQELTPTYRFNRLGYTAQPLNLQWSGQLKQIKQTLANHGWTLITRDHHIEDTLHRMASNKAQYHLPLFELLFHNNRPQLIMFKNIPQQSSIYIIRLWDAHIDFKNGQKLWIGMINRLAAPDSFITFMHHNLMSFARLKAGLPLYGQNPYWQARFVKLSKDRIPDRLKHYDWDGKIWLIKAKTVYDAPH